MEQPSSIDVGAVEVVLTNAALPMGLVINAITLHAKDLHLEKEPFKVEVKEPGSLEALLLGPNIAAFLDKEAPGGLKGFGVELRDGKIFVTASLMIMKASAVCTLRIEDEQKLYIDLESVDVMGIGARNMVQSQLEKINPVIDVSDLPMPVRLVSHTIDNGKLILHGTVLPPNS